LEGVEDRLAPATFTVANTNDSGAGSLRQAILDAKRDQWDQHRHLQHPRRGGEDN
jgi:hypothetical protein